MAYKQNFGKTPSTGHGQTFQDKGLVSPMHNDKEKEAANTGDNDLKTGGRLYTKTPYAEKGNSGMLSGSFKGKAKSIKTNKIVDFSNNNNDNLKSSTEWRVLNN